MKYLLLSLLLNFSEALRARPMIPEAPLHAGAAAALPSTANCTVLYLEQPLDHFSFGLAGAASSTAQTFQQRYYVNDDAWNGSGPIFFYAGNEADVGLYVNATGLMWENAEAFGALLVFAEHRFYGASVPAPSAGDDSAGGTASSAAPHRYLSHELALADYAVLVSKLRRDYGAADSAVVAFGGSYGGKLAAWMRMKYPSVVAGSISASAPLLAFQGEEFPWDSGSYYRVVTKTAERYSAACASNVRAVFPFLESEGATAAGRARLRDAFRLCDVPATPYKVSMLRFFVRDAFDSLAMGNYPFPTNYIAGTAAKPMPAWPAKVACSHLSDPALAASAETLLPAVRAAVAVFYNVSRELGCFDLPDYPTPATAGVPMDGIWDWQWCTEQTPDSFWFSTDGVKDMFWPNAFNETLVEQHCALAWGVAPRTRWIVDQYGGRTLGRAGHSNIVFTSGGYDGWSAGGIATNFSDTCTALMIPDGGHHLDLMWSHQDDPPSVRAARAFQLESIARWVDEWDAAAKLPRVLSWGDEL